MNEYIRSNSNDCKNPELYDALAQPSAEVEVGDFLHGLIRLLKPEYVLEIGTAFGHTSYRIASALKENGFGHLETVEKKANRHRKATKLLEGLPVDLFLGSYQEFKPQHKYDLAFFDAVRHERDKEFLTFKPYLYPKCFVMFHDTGSQHPVRPLIERLEAEGHIKTLFFPTPRGCALAQVQ